MTALVLQTAPLIGMVAPIMKAVCRHVLHALDDFAAAKARKAVPESQLRRARREVNRYRRQMHAERQAPVGR